MVTVFRAALCAALVLGACGASAQDRAPSIDDQARAAFVQGLDLLRGAQWVDAEASFRRSLALSPRPSASYDLAFVLYKQGRLRESAEVLQLLLTEPAGASDIRYRDYAATLAAVVAQEVSRQRIIATPPDTGARGTPPAEGSKLRAVAPWLTLGAAGALLAGAVVTGFLAKQADDAFGAACPGYQRCDPALVPTRDRAVQLGHVTDALLISGGTLAVAGIALRIMFQPAASPGRQGPVAFIAASGVY
ncbi:MAG TPA: hypothetical protein VKU41_01425 [Polyangiaceae bacterium]|nr:hypothetical protein [Polyangiaceae bacterium]